MGRTFMHEEPGDYAAKESNYHLIEGAEQDYIDLLQATPNLETQIREDLGCIGENPTEEGTSLERIDVGDHAQSDFSAEQLAKLRSSRVLRRETYSVYWIIGSTKDGEHYPAIWRIRQHSENEGSIAIPKVVLDIFRGVGKVLREE
jgi:hypothetical protein